MICRAVVALSASLVLVSPGLAEDCPVSGYEQIEKLLTGTQSCDRAMAVMVACSFGGSGDVGLGQIVTKKCEGIFLNKLSKSQRRSYDRKVGVCWHKYAKESGTMYRSMAAFCVAEVAQAYAARVRKAKR
jgi:ABC-type sulfate transport system substrate-binding protein